jgi:gluconate kinase
MAYTFAVAESLALTYAAAKRKFRERLRQACKTVLLVGLLLALAAALELPYV